MSALQVQSAVGLLALCVLVWVLGGCRRGVSWRVVVAGLLLQAGLAAALLHIPPLRAGFALVGDGVSALAEATKGGTALVFGYLGGAPLPFEETRPGASFILFFQSRKRGRAPASSCFSRHCRWCWWSARCRPCCPTGACCRWSSPSCHARCAAPSA